MSKIENRTGWVALAMAAVAVTMLAAPALVRAEASTFAASTFRATTDDATLPLPTGSVKLERQGLHQAVRADIRGLLGSSFALFIADNMDTNTFVTLVAAMDRHDPLLGHWTLGFDSQKGAPPQFGVRDLTNLVGKVLLVAEPGDQVITTNEFGTVTNYFVNAVLWAPIPPLVAKPDRESFSRLAILLPPSQVPPSPKSRGNVRTRYNGGNGMSVFEVSVIRLPRGHDYSLWLTDASGANPTNAGTVTMGLSGSSGRFLRDTKKGQPLPLELPFVNVLSGRGVFILDEFGDTHLQGHVP